MDARGARRRRHPAAPEAPARARRGRHGHRLRPDDGPGVRRAAERDHRRDADVGAVRRPGVLGPDRGVSRSTSRWLVAVRMVSEGVDVPRLAVGVYATSASTPLFFAQAIGRFVRSRRPGETASIFLPSVPDLLQLASEMEAQRDHVLGKPHRERRAVGRGAAGGRREAEVRAGRDGQRLRDARRRRRTRSGDLRRLVVRHRHPRGQRRGGRLPRHPRPARRRADARPVAAQAGRATRQADRRGRHGAGDVHHPRSAARSAPGTERAGDTRPPPHRQATRLDPQRAAPDLRRPGGGGGELRPDHGADRSGPLAEGLLAACPPTRPPILATSGGTPGGATNPARLQPSDGLRGGTVGGDG